MHSICGVGWGIARQDGRGVRDHARAVGPPRATLVSGLKSFVALKGCRGSLHVLPDRPPACEASSLSRCLFAQLCRSPARAAALLLTSGARCHHQLTFNCAAMASRCGHTGEPARLWNPLPRRCHAARALRPDTCECVRPCAAAACAREGSSAAWSG